MKLSTFKSCARFEVLLDENELTDEEVKFIAEHQETCALGIHTAEFLERVHNLSPGTLRKWDGVSSLFEPQTEMGGANEQQMVRIRKIISRIRSRDKIS